MVKKTKSKHKLRSLFFVFVRLSLVLFAYLVIITIYFDAQIRERIDGQVWEFPVAIYGRMINLEPGILYSLKDMEALLEGMQYRKVLVPEHSGEYLIQGNEIEMVRRAFTFPDGREESVKVRFVFSNDRLIRMTNLETNRDLGFFRLDPKLITMLQSPKGEQRLFMKLNEFPDSLIQLLLATEDRYFYYHNGVNILSIMRAMIANIRAGRIEQGGSTLTQQLIKNLFLSNERTLSRKLKEAYMAIVMEGRYDKDHILELYLNEVYLGQTGLKGWGGDQIRGFPLASIYYFGRPISELTYSQQAMLVAMVRGATLYNPWRNPEIVIKRRNLVLSLAFEQQKITESEYKNAIAQPLNLQKIGRVISPQPAFIQLVLRELHEKLGRRINEVSGVKIFTTLDPVSQRAAEKALEEGINNLEEKHNLNKLEGAMVVVDRLSGEVKALIGGANPQYAGFNRALYSRRPIGSLVKPPIYLTALSMPEYYHLNTWLRDMPLSIPLENGQTWQPHNFDRKYRHRVMLIDALSRSLNIPTVNLGREIGLAKCADMMIRLGAQPEHIHQVPAMLLGAISLSPLEVGQIYQTIGSGGHQAVLSSLRSILLKDGSMLYTSYPQSRLVISPQAAYLTLYAMQKTVTDGTARSLNTRFGQYHLAAKTGSTNDYRDSWFVGIDGKEIVVIWLGRDDNAAINLTGAAGALTIYQRYLENQNPLLLNLTVPEGVHMMPIDKDGYFNCRNGVRSLPAYISAPKVFCAMNQPPNEEDTTELSTESETEQQDDALSELIRKLDH